MSTLLENATIEQARWLPPTIGLNGPPRSGKTFLVKKLQAMLPRAKLVTIHDAIFPQFKAAGFAEAYESYQDYKASDQYDRDLYIRFANRERSQRGDGCFLPQLLDTSEIRDAPMLIFDNIGRPAEANFFEKYAHALLLLRLDTPYLEQEPFKLMSRREFNERWYLDNRMPVASDNMLTAYDSLQMSLLLDWLTAPSTVDAGPYNEYRKLWDDHFARIERPSLADSC